MPQENVMRFNEAGRALKIALALKEKGHDVCWCPESPELLFTNADRDVARQIARETKGVIDEWWKHEKFVQKRPTR